jgi:hypothetical protein
MGNVDFSERFTAEFVRDKNGVSKMQSFVKLNVASSFPFFVRYRCSRSGLLVSLLVVVAVGLARLSTIYIRCREEEGPDCPLSDFHKVPAPLHIWRQLQGFSPPSIALI